MTMLEYGVIHQCQKGAGVACCECRRFGLPDKLPPSHFNRGLEILWGQVSELRKVLQSKTVSGHKTTTEATKVALNLIQAGKPPSTHPGNPSNHPQPPPGLGGGLSVAGHSGEEDTKKAAAEVARSAWSV